jgi:TonB family protein
MHELRLLLPEHRTNTGPAVFGASLIYLICGILAVAMVLLNPPPTDPPAVASQQTKIDLNIFRNVVGPKSGGGGGGGNRSRKLEALKTEPTPAIKPPDPQPSFEPVPQPVPEPEPTPLAATVLTAEPNNAPLAVVGPAANPGTALGPGDRGAGGPGDGGIGPDNERGLGPGDDQNTGGGPFAPGDVDVQVVPTFMPKPSYTVEGVTRRIEGDVMLTCIVLATGRVGSCRITKSIDRNVYGLDDEALKTAAKFQFRPAMRKRKPVPVEVNIILEFRIR